MILEPIMKDDLVQIMVNACKYALDSKDGNLKESVITVEVGGAKVYEFRDIVYETSRKPRFPEWMRKLIPPYFVPLPLSLSLLQGAMFEKLFRPGHALRLSRDQIRLLQFDNRVSTNNGQVSTMEIVNRGLHSNLSAREQVQIQQQLSENVKFTSMDQVFSGGRWLLK